MSAFIDTLLDHVGHTSATRLSTEKAGYRAYTPSDFDSLCAALEPGGLTALGRREILHIRHHSLFTPRDFDPSPCFEIIKPRIRDQFDHRGLMWDDALSAGSTSMTALTRRPLTELREMK